jgi:hypothetical protein
MRPIPSPLNGSRHAPSPPPPPPPPTPSITIATASLSIFRIWHTHENAISRRHRYLGSGLPLPCCAPNCICCHTHVPFRGINPLPPLPQLQQQHSWTAPLPLVIIWLPFSSYTPAVLFFLSPPSRLYIYRTHREHIHCFCRKLLVSLLNLHHFQTIRPYSHRPCLRSLRGSAVRRQAVQPLF